MVISSFFELMNHWLLTFTQPDDILCVVHSIKISIHTANSVECFKKKLKKLNFLERKEVGPKMELPQIMFD